MANLETEKDTVVKDPAVDSIREREDIVPSVSTEAAPAYEKIKSDPAEGKASTPAINAKQEIVVSPKLQEAWNEAAGNTICAYGPLTSFFYYEGHEKVSWNYLYLESEVPRIVSGKALETWQIRRPYHVALSPHGAGYFAYVSHSGSLTWRFIDIDKSLRPLRRKKAKKFDLVLEAYAKLKSWLTINIISSEDIMSTKVAFGPGARYMAWKPSGSWIDNDLPPQLLIKLNSSKAAGGKDMLPSCVTFGIGNAWAAVWKDGSHTIDWDKKYAKAAEALKPKANDRILFISLNGCADTGEYNIKFESAVRYAVQTSRTDILKKAWQAQISTWSSTLDMTIVDTFTQDKETARTIVTPGNAATAIPEPVISAEKASESERLSKEAALLSVKSSKKSSSAAGVAVGAGLIAVIAGCTVM